MDATQYKQAILQTLDAIGGEVTACADAIHGYAELSGEEHRSAAALEELLEHHGFAVERGLKDLPTAFRAVYGSGPVRIGFMCEYDALAGLGHACGHHMQGPAILGAAKALKDAAIDAPYTITVYGTPAEESISGKVMMLENGCTFEELDVALMMHGGPATQVDVKSLALNKLKIIYHGVCSHAALKPEKGRSALMAACAAARRAMGTRKGEQET